MATPLMDAEPPPGFSLASLVPPPVADAIPEPVSLALDLSGTCNLACRYCAEAATQPRRPPMSLAVLEAAWRTLLPRAQNGARTSIHLGSGEPLLALPLMRHLVTWIDAACEPAEARRPDLFLTTNGTLLSDPVRDWLAASGWNVRVSLDGPAGVHDRWRVLPGGAGTFATVAEAVRDLAERMPDRLSVTAVLCRGADPQTVFDAIAALGVRSIELVPVAHRDRALAPAEEAVQAYRQFVRGHARRYLREEKVGQIPMLTGLGAGVVRAMGYALRRTSCSAGRSYLGVGPDGRVYPCFRFAGLDAYCLGSLSTGLQPDRIRAFQSGAGRAYDRRAECAACWAAPLCAGPCFANAELFGPGDGRPLGLHCAYARADAWAAAHLVTELRGVAPQRLMAFLPVAGVLEDLP